MFPASSNGGGQATAMPDVCKVPAPPAPPVPTPPPSIAMLSEANGGTCSSRVRIVGCDLAGVRLARVRDAATGTAAQAGGHR